MNYKLLGWQAWLYGEESSGYGVPIVNKKVLTIHLHIEKIALSVPLELK